MPKKAPRINQLLDNATYIGKVTTKKTVYYVFQTDRDYLLFTFKDATMLAGNFNVAMADTVDMVHTAFRGKKRVTSGDVQDHPRMKKFVTRFEALQALYVLVAKKQGSIDRRSLNKIYFSTLILKGNRYIVHAQSISYTAADEQSEILMISPLERIRNLADRYLQTDLDHITATQLSQDIAIIQGITNDIAEADELQVICQLLSKMTSHLYVARGHALASVPRSLPFYENMIKSQQLLKQIIKAME